MKTLMLVSVIAALASCWGCRGLEDHVVPGGTLSISTEGVPSGSFSLTFRDINGKQQSDVIKRRISQIRGFDSSGVYVTLNELRDIAVQAYKEGISPLTLGTIRGLSVFDQETCVIIKDSFVRLKADPRFL